MAKSIDDLLVRIKAHYKTLGEIAAVLNAVPILAKGAHKCPLCDKAILNLKEAALVRMNLYCEDALRVIRSEHPHLYKLVETTPRTSEPSAQE